MVLRGRIKGTALKPHYLVLCYKMADGKRSLEESDSGSDLKKRRVSLSLKKRKEEKEASRFASPTKRERLEEAALGVVPSNTKHSTDWAVKTFLSWVTERNIRCPDELIEEDILSCCSDAERASYVLRLFVLEVRKQNGEHYPPSTLRSILSGLNREFARNKIRFGILDKNDTRFLDLHQTLDTINSQLHREGIGVATKHASVLTIEDEDLCWEKGSLGYSTPTVLQHTVFFYTGMHFVLRGVQEHHDLMVSQLKRVPVETSVYDATVYYQYTEYISKNNLHRFTDHKFKNKVVTV